MTQARRGKVRDLERERVERLARELVPALRERGHLVAPAAELDDVERWRAAARRAGRLLGVPIRTGVNRHGHAWAAVESCS